MKNNCIQLTKGSLMVSSIQRSGFDALAGDTVLCPWARHLTLTVPLSTQKCKLVSCHATETGISSDLMGHLARMQTLILHSAHENRVTDNLARKLFC